MNARPLLRRARVWAVVVAVALAGVIGGLYAASPQPVYALVLLLPDANAQARPAAQAWIDAAREEGLPLVVMTDDQFMRFRGRARNVAGVIMPDTVHQRASDLLVSLLESYVGGGGRLFISFDAGVLDSNTWGYADGQSRLSKLAGVRYAMYSQLRERTIANGAVFGSREAERELGIQPGKFDFGHSAHPTLGELNTYGYDRLNHSFLRTGGSMGGRTLLQSLDGDVVVAKNRVGKGEVLFANLALGYLKTRTDGYFLHRLLGHFSNDMAKLPRLAAVPGARGGLVLNIHVDSNAAHKPLLQMEEWGWFKEGPFSMQVTAGPDARKAGDGLGLDLDHNVAMQEFLKRQQALGHEMGDHGGWVHDVFGYGASEDNRVLFEPWLDLNHASMWKATGRPPRVYSAPQGNQPTWATHWLERNGFKAYYFSGDTGLGPTHSYYEGRRPGKGLWAFPVSNMLKIATFEELDLEDVDVSEEEFTQFLLALARYAADNRVVRLFYFHPPAAPKHPNAMNALTAEARELAAKGRFRWYTMEFLANFLDRREATEWNVYRSGAATEIRATNPVGMAEFSWIVPATKGSNVVVKRGRATAAWEAGQWIVTAGDVKELVVEIR